VNKFEGAPEFWYISIEESFDRREKLHADFDKYGIKYKGNIYKRLEDAGYEIESHDYLADQIGSYRLMGGCSSSLIMTMRDWYERTDQEMVVICEDDISFDLVKYWNFNFTDIIKRLPVNWECIQLCLVREYRSVDFRFTRRKEYDWTTTAFLINRKFAKKLIDKHLSPTNRKYYNTKLDYPGNLNVPCAENIIFAQRQNVYNLPLFIEKDFPTTLGKQHANAPVKDNRKNTQEDIINWWTTIGQNLSADKIMKVKNLSEIVALDPENPSKNYDLAVWFEERKQYAAAYTYYFRTAERTDSPHLIYKCLIKAAKSVRAQTTREITERSLLQNAISVSPDRPEAYYYLSILYLKKKDYMNAYTNACIGLTLCTPQYLTVHSPLDLDDWYGELGLLIQKAAAGWWWGKADESREIYWNLVDNHWDELSEANKKVVEDNISLIGLGRDSQGECIYHNNQHSKLRFNFVGSEKIEKSYAQILQDMFILSMLNGKRNGSFLEVGAAIPVKRNNTYLLEKDFGWKGVAVELREDFAMAYKAERPNIEVYQDDAIKLNYKEVLKQNYDSNIIDYLQLDIEPARKTLECLYQIPFDQYKFRVITFEHDHYVDVTKNVRDASRKYLKEKGYVMVASDLSADGKSTFEDWWVHPELVDSDIIDVMTDTSEGVKKASNYLLTGRKMEKKEEPKAEFTARFSKNPQNSLWIVDNFYENPDEIRKFAIEQDYHIGGIGRGYIGNRTHKQFLFPGIKERFEEIMGKKITKFEDYGMNGRFQYCWAGQPRVYHTDLQQWGGMIYLTPDAPYEAGTALYANKANRARSYRDEGYSSFWAQDRTHLDPTGFEPVDVAGNVYNRLVIFDAACIHSAMEYFHQEDPSKCRLWQMFFFDAE
jgi:hypothetical protein